LSLERASVHDERKGVVRLKMSLALYPALKGLLDDKAITAGQGDNAIAAGAEGYAFPTTLDRDTPIGGIAPQSQQALVRRALKENWTSAWAAEAQAWRKLT
jgi:hypothetical protein